MPLRILQVILPRRHRDELKVILDEAEPASRWVVEINDDFQVTNVLVRAGEVESLTDTLQNQFSTLDGFRLVLTSVDATYPKVAEPEKPPASEVAAAIVEKKRKKPLIERVSREELQQSISKAGDPSGLFFAMLILAAIVAAAGLIKNSPAVIIGAMVIAPLLGPNMALALGTTLGDVPLIRRAIRTNAMGIVAALALTAAVGFIVQPDPMTPEIQSRTLVDFGDVALALASGAAGALAFTAGAQATVVGVMVAVALLPPTVVCGMMLGEGSMTLALGAATLVITNVVCVNLAATGVFLLQGIRPSEWWNADRAKRSSWLAITIWVILLAALVATLLLSSTTTPS